MTRLRKVFTWKSIKDNPDTYVLTIASFVVAGFSIFGSFSDEILRSVVVVLLGVLAFSQLMNRFQVDEVVDTWHRARTEIFWDDFPPGYGDAQRTVSKSYFYAGETMGRTMTAMQRHIRRVLREGGSTRILLPNPDNHELMKAIAKGRSDRSAATIKSSIKHSFELAQECRNAGGNLELRTTDIMPHISINGWDIEHPAGKIMVQMYEYRPDGTERAPVFLLEADDGKWFDHFRAQIERLWADGTKYTP
ncbi:hypothetical protein [Corynebacterium marinum]|uniref:Uncharacterized protein n=1 Tax=Corynebacterium marinum DSM 44953 TaxID=1224162 RepID=A0A0B6TNT0_9CORY|nr:hypothetical protein [Corynebacterium marinum]AJK69588.1 hypothetical protein B840_10005 [Corynebacterium marinum DSM 44953]GGO22506.1 hypothetical protein GCM10010980_24670 [Corynebacterium marinum]